jgi:hypothetical protein
MHACRCTEASKCYPLDYDACREGLTHIDREPDPTPVVLVANSKKTRGDHSAANLIDALTMHKAMSPPESTRAAVSLKAVWWAAVSKMAPNDDRLALILLARGPSSWSTLLTTTDNLTTVTLTNFNFKLLLGYRLRSTRTTYRKSFNFTFHNWLMTYYFAPISSLLPHWTSIPAMSSFSKKDHRHSPFLIPPFLIPEFLNVCRR